MLFEREYALELLKEHVETKRLLKHSFAVEGAMIYYAKKLKEDEKRWGTCGLLHDIDFEKYPDMHPLEGLKWLTEKGYDDDFVTAVRGHAEDTNRSRTSQMAKTLYAVDELASFIVAVALVRPTKFEGLSVKSVKKKLKDKAFAAAVDRSSIQHGAEELNIELSDHIQNVINALTEHEEILKASGNSLVD